MIQILISILKISFIFGIEVGCMLFWIVMGLFFFRHRMMISAFFCLAVSFIRYIGATKIFLALAQRLKKIRTGGK